MKRCYITIKGVIDVLFPTVADVLEKEGIETEILHIGNKAVRGCLACGLCVKRKDHATGKRGQGLYELYPLI